MIRNQFRTHTSWPTPKIIQTPTAIRPQRDSLPLYYAAHQATPWSPTLTPHRDAFVHHLWGGVVQYSVCEDPDKRKWVIRGEGGRTLLTYPGHSRPAHFPSHVAGSGDIVHRPDYTPHHKRSKLGTPHQRVVGTSMRNGTRHDPCIPRHWVMGCPAWTLAEPSHSRVIYISDHKLMLPASAVCCI